MRTLRPGHTLLVAVAAALAVPAAGAGSARSGSVPTQVGPGEGKLTLIAWEGYLDPKWVRPFEQQTGCRVQAKYARSSDEMLTLMRSGGGGQYDMVSASGDVSLRLIHDGDVAEVNVGLVPAWKQFFKAFQSPPNNTVKGKHYGISLQGGLNTLLFNSAKVKPAPTSASALYSSRFKGKITVPDNPIQIADAALYLSKTRPSLGIKDPYELTRPQFDAAIELLQKQRPLVRRYWEFASDEVSLFKNGDATIGAAWSYTTDLLKAAKVPVREVIPREGATGWLDTWMLSSKAKHPNCAYKWWNYISSPKVQALQATTYGETPVNKLACAQMDKLVKGSCTAYHANAPESYYASIKFWKTPLADCGNGKKDCVDYSEWVKAWNQVVS
jgi:putative spermidine/putrescine transport system substrate-binding protein